MYAASSEVYIEGSNSFTNNRAVSNGGEEVNNHWCVVVSTTLDVGETSRVVQNHVQARDRALKMGGLSLCLS